jgi:hypothetical protein
MKFSIIGFKFPSTVDGTQKMENNKNSKNTRLSLRIDKKNRFYLRVTPEYGSEPNGKLKSRLPINEKKSVPTRFEHKF